MCTARFQGPLAGGREVRVAELDAARLGRGQRGDDALGNLLALELGDGGEDVDRELRGMRVVAGDEVDPELSSRKRSERCGPAGPIWR